MKVTSSRPATRRAPWKRRGALFVGGATLGALILAIGIREWPRLSLFPNETPPASQTARENQRNRSLTKALGQIDGKTVAAYLERYAQGEQNSAAPAPRLLYIDTESLARRHPAFQLAAELENGQVSPAPPQIVRGLTFVEQNGKDGKMGAISALAPQLFSPPRPISGKVIVAQGAAPSEAAPKRALNDFLNQSAARDARRTRDEAFLARRSLEDATELARRRAVSELDLPGLSPEIALELLNLRLLLLRNLSRTPEQREAAREEIRAIEARYVALLERQTREQAAQMRALTVDRPNQTRREGLEKIARVAQLAAQYQAQTRRSLRIESQNRWQRDADSFNALRLALPPLQRVAPRQNVAFTPSISLPPRARADFFETAPLKTASNAPLEAKNGVSSVNRAQLAARLRIEARADAVLWAKSAALRLGGTWSQNSGALNATPQALALIFPALAG